MPTHNTGGAVKRIDSAVGTPVRPQCIDAAVALREGSMFLEAITMNEFVQYYRPM